MESFRRLMKDGEDAMETGGPQYKEMVKNCTRTSELPKCNESRDIRDEGVKSDPFCPSGNRNVMAETKASKNEYSGYGKDENLHSDTTIPKQNEINGNYDDPWTGSAKDGQDRIMKNSDAISSMKDIKKERSLNS